MKEKGKCIRSDVPNGELTLGRVYDIKKMSFLTNCQLIDDRGMLIECDISGFRILKNPTKISKLKDLDTLINKNGNIKLFLKGKTVNVCYFNNGYITKIDGIDIELNRLKIIVSMLNERFGFDLKYVKKQKVSKRLYYLCKAYPKWWLARNETDKTLYLFSLKPALDNISKNWKSCGEIIEVTKEIDFSVKWIRETVECEEIINAIDKKCGEWELDENKVKPFMIDAVDLNKCEETEPVFCGSNLLKKVEREPCRYCDGRQKEFGNNKLFGICDGHIVYYFNSESAMINYCPKCGKKLK